MDKKIIVIVALIIMGANMVIATSQTSYMSVSVVSCGPTYLELYNTGVAICDAVEFGIYHPETGRETGGTLTISPLNSEEVTRANVSGFTLEEGERYLILAPRIASVTFRCLPEIPGPRQSRITVPENLRECDSQDELPGDTDWTLLLAATIIIAAIIIGVVVAVVKFVK